MKTMNIKQLIEEHTYKLENILKRSRELMSVLDKECEHQYTEDSLNCVYCGKSRVTITSNNPKQQLLQKFEELAKKYANAEYLVSEESYDKEIIIIAMNNLKNFLSEAISQTEKETRENTIKEIGGEIQKVIQDSKATFFTKDPSIEPSLGDALYELKAEISDNVGMYFYNKLKVKNNIDVK